MSFTKRAIAFARLWLLPFVLIAGLVVPGLANADGYRPFSRIVVFGDSLSDSGNLFALASFFGLDAPGEPANNWSMNTPEELLTLVPGQAYISGRLSNGPTWVELLGSALGLGPNVRPVFANPADLTRFNFAVAGATAGNTGSLPPQFNLAGQVGSYLARLDAAAEPSGTLHIIAIGGNDVRAAAAAAAQFGPQVAAGILGQALASVEQAIRDLNAYAGATKFLIWNIPDVGSTPAFRRLNDGVPQLGFAGFPGIAELTTALIAGQAPQRDGGYNALLKARVQALSTELGAAFVYFDAFQELSEVRKHPRRYGLANASDACIQVMPFFAVPGICAQADRHFFWDGIHPTRAGHAVLAYLVAKALVHAAVHDD